MVNKEKKELAVAALQNGTVIDHIPTESLFKVVDLLGLKDLKDVSVTIGNNLDSNRMVKKGIIKVADMFFPEETLNRIAVIAPNVVVNIIRDFEVVEKLHVALPDELLDSAAGGFVWTNPGLVIGGSDQNDDKTTEDPDPFVTQPKRLF